MASLTQKRGIWYLWITENGKRKGISLKTRDYKEAVRSASKIESSSHNKRSSIKTSKLFDKWKSWNSTLSSQYVHISFIFWKQLMEKPASCPKGFEDLQIVDNLLLSDCCVKISRICTSEMRASTIAANWRVKEVSSVNFTRGWKDFICTANSNSK